MIDDLELDEVSNATLITNLQNKIIELETELDILKNPIYCPNCDSCGEEGCCSPDKCKTCQLHIILEEFPWHNLHCSTSDWNNFKSVILNQFKTGIYCDSNIESYNEMVTACSEFYNVLVDISNGVDNPEKEALNIIEKIYKKRNNDGI